jgi:hypothetical protein
MKRLNDILIRTLLGAVSLVYAALTMKVLSFLLFGVAFVLLIIPKTQLNIIGVIMILQVTLFYVPVDLVLRWGERFEVTSRPVIERQMHSGESNNGQSSPNDVIVIERKPMIGRTNFCLLIEIPTRHESATN